MCRTLLGLLAEGRIWRLTPLKRGDDLFLVGDNDEEHVTGHPGRNQGPYVQERGARAEDLAVAVGRCYDHRIHKDA